MMNGRSKPLVSIGVPVFNGEIYIENALESLLAQSYENIEIIIADNNSTDATPSILEKYNRKYDYIKIHINKQNIGLHRNFTNVLNFAQGEYFMWAAVDDNWSPEFVSKLVEELENFPQAVVAMCAVNRIREDGSPLDSIHFHGYNNPNRKSYIGMAVALTSMQKYNLFIYGLFRTKLLKLAISQFLPIPSGERWFLMQFALAFRFRYIDQALHVRTANMNSYQDRYPTDEFGEIKQSYLQKSFCFLQVRDAYQVLTQSELIPKNRKIYFPIVLANLISWRIYEGIYKTARSLLGRFCPRPIKEFIKKVI
jgi:glycosyltransferase involved in cell wall biosynthesis